MRDAPEAVLDTTALIALLRNEAGAEAVRSLLGRAVISAVTWAEVLQRYRADEIATTGMRNRVEALGIEIAGFSADDAERAAGLWAVTRRAGLSLASCACLALGSRLRLSVYTTDRNWSKLDVSIEVVLIR